LLSSVLTNRWPQVDRAAHVTSNNTPGPSTPPNPLTKVQLPPAVRPQQHVQVRGPRRPVARARGPAHQLARSRPRPPGGTPSKRAHTRQRAREAVEPPPRTRRAGRRRPLAEPVHQARPATPVLLGTIIPPGRRARLDPRCSIARCSYSLAMPARSPPALTRRSLCPISKA